MVSIPALGGETAQWALLGTHNLSFLFVMLGQVCLCGLGILGLVGVTRRLGSDASVKKPRTCSMWHGKSGVNTAGAFFRTCWQGHWSLRPWGRLLVLLEVCLEARSFHVVSFKVVKE